MGNMLGELLPLAIGIALSPLPVVAQILMLFGKRARSNGPAFMLGWVLPLAIWGSILLVVADSGKIGGGGTPIIASVIKLLLGVLFLFMAYRSWKSLPEPGEEPKLPAWMATLDSFTAGKSFGFAALLSSTNPKNVGRRRGHPRRIGRNHYGARLVPPLPANGESRPLRGAAHSRLGTRKARAASAGLASCSECLVANAIDHLHAWLVRR